MVMTMVAPLSSPVERPPATRLLPTDRTLILSIGWVPDRSALLHSRSVRFLRRPATPRVNAALPTLASAERLPYNVWPRTTFVHP